MSFEQLRQPKQRNSRRSRLNFQTLEQRKLLSVSPNYVEFDPVVMVSGEFRETDLTEIEIEDVNGDGRSDIIQLTPSGIDVALASDGGFSAKEPWLEPVTDSLDWARPQTVTEVADINNDGRADIVRFGEYGVMVATANEAGDGFDEPLMWSFDFGTSRGWSNPGIQRSIADINGDGMLDIVGFGQFGFFVATANSKGDGFNPISQWRYVEGWGSEDYQRELADVNSDGKADIVGFGDKGVWVALAGVEEFEPPQLWLEDFGKEQGWSVSRHHRALSDVNGDGLQDVVGFWEDGTYVALSNGSGFRSSSMWLDNFSANYGWTLEENPRYLVDMDLDGISDVVGFGAAGVYVSMSTGSGFTRPELEVPNFHRDYGWLGQNTVRKVVKTQVGARPDIVGLSQSGAFVARSSEIDVVHQRVSSEPWVETIYGELPQVKQCERTPLVSLRTIGDALRPHFEHLRQLPQQSQLGETVRQAFAQSSRTPTNSLRTIGDALRPHFEHLRQLPQQSQLEELVRQAFAQSSRTPTNSLRTIGDALRPHFEHLRQLPQQSQLEELVRQAFAQSSRTPTNSLRTIGDVLRPHFEHLRQLPQQSQLGETVRQAFAQSSRTPTNSLRTIGDALRIHASNPAPLRSVGEQIRQVLEQRLFEIRQVCRT